MTGENVRRETDSECAVGRDVPETDCLGAVPFDGADEIADGGPVPGSDTVLTDPATDEPAVSAADGRHLRAVLLASLCGGAPVGTTTLADRVGVTPATVTERVVGLADRGLVTHEPYVGVELTDRGERIARAAQWRQCVVQRHFETTVGVRLPSRFAYRVGVTLPPAVLERLRRRLADGEPDDESTGGYCDAVAPDDCPRVDCASG